MITIVPKRDFELIKKLVEDQMVAALKNKCDDIETFERLANLNKRLNQATELYTNHR